jgi:hypothetical protein
MDNNNRNNENPFSYYVRIVMLIILLIEFILSIVFLGVMKEINSYFHSNYIMYFDYQYKCISLTFSFSIISLFVFVIEYIANRTCGREACEEECSGIISFLFFKLNHFISLITFLICQILYLVDCCIIPVYLQGIKNALFFQKAEKKYTALTVVAFIFLGIILILDLIILNLYKDICCKMTRICDKTKECFENFAKFFDNIVCCRCCYEPKNTVLGEMAQEMENHIQEKKNLTCEIRNLLAENTNSYFRQSITNSVAISVNIA